tara:strand:- start:443 stop:712 length:270 start_codon:yes stop_codon:yes gene_type:complete
MKNEVSKTIKFGPSNFNENVFVPSKWFLDDVEVTEMEYYGITPETTLSDLGGEPSCIKEFQEWKMKKTLIEERDGVVIFGQGLFSINLF